VVPVAAAVLPLVEMVAPAAADVPLLSSAFEVVVPVVVVVVPALAAAAQEAIVLVLPMVVAVERMAFVVPVVAVAVRLASSSLLLWLSLRHPFPRSPL